jgi:hypothetical protein
MKISNKTFTLNLLTICFTVAMITSSCKRDFRSLNVNEQEELPPATQEGKNTFGCLINGKVWVSARAPYSFTTNGQFIYGIYPSEGRVLIMARKLNIKPTEDIVLNSNNITSVGSYKLFLDQSASPGSTSYYDGNLRYLISDTINSNLTITKYDTINQIISGTFYFNFIKNNTTNKVTNGVFDLKWRF